MAYRRGTSSKNKVVLLVIVVFILFIVYLLFSLMNPGNQAKKVVSQFYTYEQKGAFSDSWELFHPLMQQRFSKSHYIQDRAHVFMNHFGVDSFSYTLSEPDKVKNWTMTKDNEEALFDEVYKIKVTQTFKGKYGHFDIQQNVFVTENDEGDWGILWDYKK